MRMSLNLIKEYPEIFLDTEIVLVETYEGQGDGLIYSGIPYKLTNYQYDGDNLKLHLFQLDTLVKPTLLINLTSKKVFNNLITLTNFLESNIFIIPDEVQHDKIVEELKAKGVYITESKYNIKKYSFLNSLYSFSNSYRDFCILYLITILSIILYSVISKKCDLDSNVADFIFGNLFSVISISLAIIFTHYVGLISLKLIVDKKQEVTKDLI